jgi:hypothetical protein
MRTDTAIKNEGMKILVKNLGKVDAEKFITLINREHFDYTKWQQNLWNDKSVEDLCVEAMNYRIAKS